MTTPREGTTKKIDESFKTLGGLVESKFNVGDRVRDNRDDELGVVVELPDSLSDPKLVKVAWDDEGDWTASSCLRKVQSTESARQVFETGARRDAQNGKSRPDFIDPNFLLRVGEHLSKGAEHYGDFNFTKGIPSQRYMAGLFRHILKYYAGWRDEDHLAAIVFNAMGLAMNEGTELEDTHKWEER